MNFGLRYQLKVTLRGSKPPIWRRVIVPAECALETLHAVIQATMGWANSHLHSFNVNGREFDGRDPMGGIIDSGMDSLDAAAYRLCDVAGSAKAKINYQYDFGDDWRHLIVVEKILPPDESNGAPAFTCISGAGACPPEDCGGIWGYYRMLEVLKDPRHEEYEDIKEWTGGSLAPDVFDLAAANARLARLRKRE